MKTQLSVDESIVKEGKANLQRGFETVGGQLYLSNQRLIFEAHSFNIQTGSSVISLKNVTDVVTCWTKFLNLFPLMPNSIKVITKAGEEYRFVVFGRDEWLRSIKSQLPKAG